VKQVRAGYKVQPLSAFLGTPAPPTAPAIDWPKFEQTAFTTGFPAYLDFLLQFCPPVGTAAVEKPLHEQFARIGIGPSRKAPHKDLTPAAKAVLGDGVKTAFAKIEKTAESVGTLVNGWQIGAAAGSHDFYKGNWALRAGPVVALHAAWTRGVVRVAGSWIAAIGLLMLDVCCIHTPPVAT
jgi:hypothetical protein